MKLALTVLKLAAVNMDCGECPLRCGAENCLIDEAVKEVKEYYEEHEAMKMELLEFTKQNSEEYEKLKNEILKNANGKNNEIKDTGND